MRRQSAWRWSSVRCDRQGKGVSFTSNVVANCEGNTDSTRWRAMYSAERSNQVPRSNSPVTSVNR
jgi:hypothetical protein